MVNKIKKLFPEIKEKRDVINKQKYDISRTFRKYIRTKKWK